MEFKKKLLVGIATTMIGFSASAATWTVYTFGPAETLGNVQGLKRILEDVEKSTDGEMKFRLRLAGSLPIQATNITQAVGNGTVLFADDGFHLGNVKIAGVLRLPMLLRTVQDYQTAFNIMRPYIDKEFERQGVTVLGNYLFPHQVAFSSKTLTNLDQFQGQKMRVSSPEQAAFVELVKGVPVTLGGSEVPSALQTSTIDGVFTASAGGGKIWGSLLNYNYRLPLNYFDGFYIVNKEAFDKLSPNIQKKFRDAVERLAPTTTAQLYKEELEVTAKLKANGMDIVEPTPEDIARATKLVEGYWQQWAQQNGPDAVKLLAEVRAAVGR
jgi:TRAP-type C4-dicarboxylate transport system substrate-binding protein